MTIQKLTYVGIPRGRTTKQPRANDVLLYLLGTYIEILNWYKRRIFIITETKLALQTEVQLKSNCSEYLRVDAEIVRSFTTDTNLHAISCQRDNASRHSQKQTMPCLIPPWWSRRPTRTTWHRDNKCTRTKATAIPPHFIRTSQTTNQWRSREDQQGTLKKRRDTTHCLLRECIHTPSSKPICHDLTRHSPVRLDRVRTCYGRFKYNMNLMGLSPSASCECGAASQIAHHLASECPLHSCWGDLVTLNSATCSVP